MHHVNHATLSNLNSSGLPLLLFRRRQRLRIPDLRRILIDTPITAKEAHARHRRNRLGKPLILVAVGLVNQLLGLAVAREIVGDEIKVAMLDDAVYKS
jgi:hypothetical protein